MEKALYSSLRMSDRTSSGSRFLCQARSLSANRFSSGCAACTAFAAYRAAPREWSAMCAVAAAWPAARATALAASSPAARAAACASTEALRASPTEAWPRDHARAVSIARWGRSSPGHRVLKRYNTCSAHSAAQRASRRCRSESSRPPRRIVLNLTSLMSFSAQLLVAEGWTRHDRGATEAKMVRRFPSARSSSQREARRRGECRESDVFYDLLISRRALDELGYRIQNLG